MTASTDYLQQALRVLQGVLAHEMDAIDSAAAFCADAVDGGGLIHAFGTGHSHMLAEELFYRAGGLVAVNPILEPDLMLHVDAVRSTSLERDPEFGREVASRLEIVEGDAVIISSNSGGSAVAFEVAKTAAEAGANLIVILSRVHAAVANPPGTPSRLEDLADVVIDNHGTVGDASVTIDGVDQRVGPTSTIAGAAVVNAIAAATVERLVAAGRPAPVFASSNVDGGDRHNLEVIARYRDRIGPL